jgi:hypothetical protein
MFDKIVIDIDKIVIGKGDAGNSAIVCRKELNWISENSVSYWISLKYPLNIEITVFKNTEVGKTIAQMIKIENTYKNLEEYLFNNCLMYMSYKMIAKKIEEKNKENYERGKEDTQKEILKALGIS